MKKKVESMEGEIMSNRCETSIPFVDNLYAFLGWVVSYSDYGKEIAVDTILKRFKLIEKIDDSVAFDNKKEFDEYNVFLEDCIKNVILNGEFEIILTENEIDRCRELESEFTPRFKRAKQFTMQQIAEYKAKKVFDKEGVLKLTEPIDPIKIVDHESRKVVCSFYSPEYAAKVLGVNTKKVKDMINRKCFYKGYVWMSCEIDSYKEYDKKLNNCRKLSKKACNFYQISIY